jgi:hypothetical protein
MTSGFVFVLFLFKVRGFTPLNSQSEKKRKKKKKEKKKRGFRPPPSQMGWFAHPKTGLGVAKQPLHFFFFF